MTAADKTNATKSLLYILSDGKNLPLKFSKWLFSAI